MPPFERLTIAQFAAVLAAFPMRRRITAVHMHHTWRPNHAQWRGHDSMVGMWHFHTHERKFSDIAQHLTIDPEGFVWTGRDWNSAPASAVGHNGNAVAGPFMFETVGDFDIGRDLLQGAQRRAVLDVIKLVQQRFGLAPESLLFHNQLSGKSCPGSAIDREAFLDELRAHALQPVAAAAPAAPRSRARGGAARALLPLPEHALAGADLVQRTLARMNATPAAPAHDDECACGQVDAVSDARAARAARRDAPLTPEDIDRLRPHVINLRMGRFSSHGLMTTNEADVDRLVGEHLRAAAEAAQAQGETLRVVLFAHGGLVSESAGLGGALGKLPWWRANNVYPIHFVWETGLFETLGSMLERARGRVAPRGVRNWFSDHISDPVLEAAVRALGGERVWATMKLSARQASEQGGGAHYFVQRLAELMARGVPLELHAVGHSAGAIFHAELLQAGGAAGWPALRSVQLLAPAIRCDAFSALVAPLVGAGIDALTVFTMKRDFERDDNCAGVYRKSLLYLVSRACESDDDAPVLGLEDSLRADAALVQLFGLGMAPPNPRAQMVWSKSPIADGRSASHAVSHGDFDDDAPTMNSVMRRVLDLADADPLPQPYPAGASRGARSWLDEVDWPPELLSYAAWQPPTPPAPPRPPALPASMPSSPALLPSAGGRRLALCIGIDAYPTAPLFGCCNDAERWARTLAGCGFAVETRLDVDRAAMVGAIESLFGRAVAGDQLVIQFAGHGTQVDDLDGDELGGDTPGLDEAFCPLDFESGAFFIDDDLGALIDRLAPGVALTLFIDCCHSGTISRLGRGAADRPPSADARPRFVRATPERRDAHRAWRAQHAAAAAGARSGGSSTRSELLFSACRSDQVAWESNGQGEFTLHATTVLAGSGGRLSPRELQQQVEAAFGAQPRQQPLLDGPAARLDQPLFGR
ncbi:caspase family protein [Aquabacterium humicola]|uniref:caspase family protein n=1 Tax=Aquabacterium humicola TaxID=3237377 RepID=UPI00254367BB|nr:caspase family protein [Rubrivivax pictus]